MATHRIATIKGTFATPGVSRNGRYYSAEMIAETVAEAQKAIDAGEMPISMLTGHGGRRDALGANVADTAGRVTKVSLSREGHGLFEADIADTTAGRDVATLATGGYLKGVSMAGVWKGIPHKVRVNGVLAETADGVSMRGIDFTHNPGVVDAHIASAAFAESAPAGLICEELEEVVFVEETDGAAVVTQTSAATAFADAGYHGEKRFALDTPADIRSSWVQLHQRSVTESYSPKQVRRMRGKVQSAAKKANFDIVAETSLLGAEILEAYTSVCVDNGPADLRVSAYIDDPSKIKAVTQKVAIAALAALASLDPDNDGDIDLGLTEDNDDQMDDSGTCPGCGADVTADANFCPACGTPIPQGESAPTEKGAVMPEATTSTGAVTEDAPITAAMLSEAVKTAVEQTLEAVKAAGEPVVEAESPELIAARALVAEADKSATATETTTTTAAAVVTEAAPSNPFGMTAAQLEAAITEATKTAAESASKATLEAVRAEVVETIRNGGGRRGLVSKSVLEQAPEELYGENSDLSKLSLAEMANLTDKVAAPLLGASA